MEKAFWRSIVEAKFAVPEGFSPAQLLPELMEGLGAPDPELRDHLCLEILWSWIMEGRYASAELRTMADRLLADLRRGLGEGENDLVFRRTFAVLILGVIVLYDAKHRFLSAEELGQIFEGGLRYLAEEQDLRGYTADKGWAHAAAHTADLMRALAAHPALAAADLERIVAAIVAKVMAPTVYPFVENEDGRLSRAVIAVLERGLLSPQRLAALLGELGGAEPRYKTFVVGPDNARYHNARAFLHSLYLMLARPDLPEAARTVVQPAVYDARRSFSPWGL